MSGRVILSPNCQEWQGTPIRLKHFHINANSCQPCISLLPLIMFVCGHAVGIARPMTIYRVQRRLSAGIVLQKKTNSRFTVPYSVKIHWNTPVGVHFSTFYVLPRLTTAVSFDSCGTTRHISKPPRISQCAFEFRVNVHADRLIEY